MLPPAPSGTRRDRWDPQRLDVEGREGRITGKQQEYGTANAVYTFLQDRLFKLVAAAGCLGIYIDSVWEHWATQGPQYYVMAQLTWNPRQDGRTVLDDYYRRGFGPAADSVRRYFETLEQARMEYVAKNGYAAGAINLGKLLTPQLLDAAESHLHQAAEAAAEDRDAYHRRVEWGRAGCRFTRLVAENARLAAKRCQEPSMPSTLRAVPENGCRGRNGPFGPPPARIRT